MLKPISSRELARQCSTASETGDVWADISSNPLAREIIQSDSESVDGWTMDEWYFYADDDERLHQDEFGEWL